MGFSDWVSYAGFLSVADEDLPAIDGDELEVIEVVYELSAICSKLG